MMNNITKRLSLKKETLHTLRNGTEINNSTSSGQISTSSEITGFAAISTSSW
jgi:hypothetical protein